MAAARTDPASLRDLVATFLPTLTQGRAPLDRARLRLTALTKGDRWGSEFTTTSCEVGRDSARRLQLSQDVQSSLFHVFDMWRGKGGAHSLNGDDIPIAARIARLTGIAVLFESIAGTDGAVQAVRRRAGGWLDPRLVACFTDHAAVWLDELAESDVRAVVLEAEPHPRVTVPGPHVVAEVFADLADLKSPYFHGHSRAVAALASGAAAHLRLREATRDDLEVAGLLHDVGRVAISNAVWDKPGRLTDDESELVRLHAYHSERILAGSAQLERFVPLVGRHHERLDGSGYHRGSRGEDLSMAPRILGAADMYRTLTERRPHRAAVAPEAAQRRVLDEAAGGRLDKEAVAAVLVAAGRPAAARPRPSTGLSDREVELLALVTQVAAIQKSLPVSSSHAARRSITCSTSARRSACPAAPRRPCSPSSTV